MQFLNFLLHLFVISFISAFLSLNPAAQARGDEKSDNEKINDIARQTSLTGGYLAAKAAMADNDNQAAALFLRQSLDLDSGSDQIRHNLFLVYLANGQIREATALARDMDMTEHKAGGHVISLVNGVEFIRKRSWSRAPEAFSSLKNKSELDNLIANIISAWAKYGNGQTQEALERISNFNVDRWMELIQLLHHGLILSASGNEAGATKVLQKAVAMRDIARFMGETYIDAVHALSRSWQRQGKSEKALASVENGLKIFPENYSLKSIKKALNRKKTIPLLATNARQGCAELLYNLGSVVGRNGNLTFSWIYLQLAKWLDPDSAPVALSLAELYEKKGDFKSANANYERINAGSPYKHRALLETATNLNEMKDVKGAIKILQNLIENNPSSLTPYMTLGRIFNQNERYQDAVDVFSKAIVRIPDDKSRYWSYYYYRAIAFERLNKWEETEADFKKALELEPDRSVVLNYLGYSWVDRGVHLEEGLDLIRKAVTLSPNAGFIIDSLGWAYYRLGRYQDAVMELEKAISILPQDPVVNDHLGDAYWKTDRKLEARFQWRHALDAKPVRKEEAKIRQKLRSGIVEVEQEPLAKSR